MAINRINLQIGGPGPEEYAKRKVMREVQGINEEIDSVVAQFIEEEEEKSYLLEEAPVVQERQLTRQERLAESLTLYNTKTNQTLQEVSPFSDGERIKLLEDAFAQMRRGQPQTLVSGIGASLDSGGGAVWLWDLEDVSIGAPSNGVYPGVTDGSFLAYNAAIKSWQAVENSSSANALSGAVIKATGGSANSGGNLVIEATDATDGNFTIKNASAAETFVIDGSTGDTTVKGGKVIVQRTTSGSNLTVQGKTVNSPTDATDTLLGTVTASGDASDSVRYFGTVTDDNDVANKKYVDDALDGLNPSGGFTFKGTTDITGTAPSSPAAGDFYINLVAGTAAASWTGIAGIAIAADQLIIYSGESSRWFAGAVEGADPNVLKSGDTMTGSLTITPDSGSNALIIKDGSTTKTQLFKGGAATFGGTVTAGNVSSGNIKPTVDDTYVLGDSSLSWSSAHINEVHSAGIINSGTLVSSGTTQLGTATAGTRIILGNTNMVGNASSPTYEIEGGASANIIIDRCADNGMSFPQIIIQGKTIANDGVKTNDLLAVTREAGNVADSIEYYGRTTGGGDIQTRTSSDSRYARLASTNYFSSTQNIKIAGSQFAISVEETNSTVDTIRLYGNGEIQCKKITQTDVNSPSAFAGALNLSGALTTLSMTSFARTSVNTNDWMIQGRTTSQPSNDAGLLFYVSRDPASSGSDSISYTGLTNATTNIQTK
ncbi:MAG: hypothetical protein HOM38_09440, partial [Euryarchaeota archaeon]|nr:hypothetical protein [Euryarchaeota archaeon]